jgi:hypothetical protein
MTDFFNKKTALISFFILIAVQMLCYNYIDYIQMEPRSIHSWRQSDCLSFVLNFYNGRTTFFEPGVNNLGPTGDGKTASDFPMVQYAVAQIWKVTGISTSVYRFINLGFLILGLFYIYNLYTYWFKERYWLAILATGLIFTSTLLAYYGPTPLSDIQALGLSCVGFYYFVVWLDDPKKKYFIVSIIVFTIAGLLKMSSAFIFAIAISYWFIRLISDGGENKKGLVSISTVGSLILPFIPWVLWYLYVGHYNTIHPNDYFLIGVLPVWIVPEHHIIEILEGFKKDILPIVFNVQFLSCLAIILVAGFILHIKSLFKEASLRILMPVLCILSYMILFFKVFGEHDYYLINTLPVLVILLGLLLKYALDRFPVFFDKKVVQAGFVLILCIFTHQTAVLTRARIEMKGWGFDSFVLTQERKEYFEWNSWYDRSHYAILESIKERTLDSISLTKDQKVLCLGDLTINRSLFLLNRLGYTSFRQEIGKIDEFIAFQKEKGLHFLIVIDWDNLPKEKLAPYLKNKVYEKENMSIYKF